MISQQFNRTLFLYNIVSIHNIKSIFQHGILSRNLIEQMGINHIDISDNEVQSRRNRVVVPGGFELHAYANVYFNPRNAMLYKRLNWLNNLCVLKIDKRVLDLKNTVISDANASAAGTSFWAPEDALKILNFNTIYSKSWDFPDYRKRLYYKQTMMAEVLVLNKISKEYIIEILVPNDVVYRKILEMDLGVPVSINECIFFIE